MPLRNLGDLREFYANKSATNDTPRKTKKQIFDNMEFVRDINHECFNPAGKEITWVDNQGAVIKQHLIHIDFDNMEK
jgi:hypothetical protein